MRGSKDPEEEDEKERLKDSEDVLRGGARICLIDPRHLNMLRGVVGGMPSIH